MSETRRERVDLLLRNGRILDVFSSSFFSGDLAIRDGMIVGFGAHEADHVRDLEGAWVIPGLIDTHVHLESSQLSPREFARAVLPHGTTAVIADPHEIANVLGVTGVRAMLEATAELPLRSFFMAPSCVPATPFEGSGASLGPEEIAEILSWDRVLGLGEVMNYPGVLAADSDLMAKLASAGGRPIDGHAPGLRGPDLWRYASAGPMTDHECTTADEAREKLRAGMHILIREGTTARNLAALLPLLTEATAPFVHFCTDDRHPETLRAEGHIDDLVRKAIAAGSKPETVLSAATLHAARAYGLPGLGALAPGYEADFLVVRDLESFVVHAVYLAGQHVAEDGVCRAALPERGLDVARSTIKIAHQRIDLRVPASGRSLRGIDVVADQVITREFAFSPRVEGDDAVADPDQDLLKLAVIERHHGTGDVGLGFVRGFGLTKGALASSVAHDSHNLIVAGASDADMQTAIDALASLGGGQVVVAEGEILAELPLPIAGLMSDEPLETVADAAAGLDRAAASLGSRLPAPFMTLSFLGLPVIPHLKLTARGLVDVDRFQVVSLETDTG